MDYEIRKARPEDYDDIIDFANMVFKIDFRALHPKLYDNHPEQAENHFLALEGGKIKALVGSIPFAMEVAGKPLTGYGIGTVSVHPYTRGKGYMKALMAKAVEEAREKGADFMCLGGLRQRYEYYGFSSGSLFTSFTVTPTNRRHLKNISTEGYAFVPLSETGDEGNCRRLYESQKVFARRGDFAEICRTWDARCFVIRKDGDFAGYCILSPEKDQASEMLLETGVDPGAAVLALVEFCGREVRFTPSYDQWQLISALTQIAEGASFSEGEKIQVLNYPRFTEAFLQLKSDIACLMDGSLAFEVQGQGRFEIRSEKGKVTVAETVKPAAWSLPHIQAQNRLFGMGQLFHHDSLLENNFLPIPIVFHAADMV